MKFGYHFFYSLSLSTIGHKIFLDTLPQRFDLFPAEGTPLCKIYIFMCRPKGYGFCAVSIWKTSIDFAHFGLESGMVVEGTTRVYKRIFRFNFK